MIGAFAYLTARTVRNRLVSMAHRIRQPRYAIGLLLLLAYFGFLIWGGVQGKSGRGPSGLLQTDGARAIVPAALAIMLLSSWISGNALYALAFTRAEVAMLLPAPVTRRGLILYKIWRAQLPILLNVLIFTLIWGSRSPTLPRALSAVGLYVMFATLHLHRLGAALVMSSAIEHGRAAVRRNWVSYVMALGVVVTMAVVVMDAGSHADGGDAGGASLLTRAIATLSVPWVKVILTPFALIAGPSLARTYAEWGVALAGAVAMLALHLVWVLKSHTAFEETAAEQSERVQAMRESFRKRGVATPETPKASPRFTFPLRPLGPPAVAIVWKNSLAFIRTFRPGQLLFVMAMPAVTGGIFGVKSGHTLETVAGICAMLAAVLLLAGGMTARNDLRGDLLNLSSLKTVPLSGSALVLAEVSSSALPLALMQCALLWTALAALQLSRHPMAGGVAVSVAISLPAGIAGLNLIASTIRNGVAVLFPAWVRLGGDGGPGFEVMGQAMIGLLAMLIGLIAVAIAPALVTLAIVAWIQPPPSVSIVASVTLGAVAAFGESYLVMIWLGRVLDRTEPAASLSPS
ncbi:MAG TPA: putative ABC exporter domain-containing protein [Gemmatimonadaceae bacterium]